MSSHEPSPGDAEIAQAVSRNHVVVTRALVPGAPLLVDDFNNDVLEGKVRGLPNASRLLDWERNLHPTGHIDIERLMTRLDALMPYDYAENAGNAANEYGFLLSELKRAFLERLHEARKGEIHGEELKRFVKYCETYGCCCITFNYDDFLDEALALTGSWKPYWGIRVLLPVVTGHHRHFRRTGNALGSPAAEAPRLDQLATETGLCEPGRDRQHHTPSRVDRHQPPLSAGWRSS